MSQPNRLANIGLRSLAAWTEILFYFPFLLIAGVYGVGPAALPYWFGSSLILCAACCAIGSIIPTNRKMLVRLGLAMAGVAAAWLLMGWQPSHLPAFAAIAVLCYRSAQISEKNGYTVYPLPYYWIGILSYFVAFLLMQAVDSLKPYAVAVAVAGTVSVIYTITISNRMHLSRANLDEPGRSAVPKAIRKFNAVYSAALTAAVLLAAYVIPDLSVVLWSWFRRLMAWLFRERPVSEPPPSAEQAPAPLLPLPQEERHTSEWMQLLLTVLNVIAWIIAGIAAAALIFFVLRSIVRRWMPALWAWLMRLFRAYDADQQENGYMDEHTNLLTLQMMKQRLKTRIFPGKQRPERELPYEALADNRLRVRYLYRMLIKRSVQKGYSFHASYTPRETLDEVSRWLSETQSKTGENRSADSDEFRLIAELYNRARYGTGKINDAEVQQMRSQVDKSDKLGFDN
ncbi:MULTISPECIES: DUF4129 domain-containing protein [unclassified Paenibacillus]|uniref:DUF4129 domain-containing protein n=1 Tax=unclassified Paenibacillus TaxID=185978 RepID=UPI001C125032|nr:MULTISPECIES: DUF4129 domain-containing protein [unclassified Paenibacillus]MBU5442687.1 DUF4129 domain-containing protein [Paenibacillus sp. MSJ-34]CAH0120993.1 hypothetical protein PAE9249_03518 [Paenibacillus sp. CECT 9249]